MNANNTTATMSNEHRALNIISACLREVSEGQDFDLGNFERTCIEEAAGLLWEGYNDEAIKALAEGCAHAFRDGYTEDRPESYACAQAWEALTGKAWGGEAAGQEGAAA